MKKPHRHCRELQLELFHPPRKTPEWRALPMEVRERARLFLAQMLRMSSVRYDSAESQRAAGDE
jgi:hypothetical protein